MSYKKVEAFLKRRNFPLRIRAITLLLLTVLSRRYAESYLSVVWFFLAPLAPILVFYLLFSGDRDVSTYLFEIAAPYSLFYYFSSTISHGLRLYRSYRFLEKITFGDRHLSLFVLGLPDLFQGVILLFVLLLAGLLTYTGSTGYSEVNAFTLSGSPVLFAGFVIFFYIHLRYLTLVLAHLNRLTRDIKFLIPYLLLGLSLLLPIYPGNPFALGVEYLSLHMLPIFSLTHLVKGEHLHWHAYAVNILSLLVLVGIESKLRRNEEGVKR